MRLSSSTASHSPFASQAGVLAQASLFPKLMIRPIETVFGWTDRQSAEWDLARDRGNFAAAEKNYTCARANLGTANRSKRLFRRHRQASAMRALACRWRRNSRLLRLAVPKLARAQV